VLSARFGINKYSILRHAKNHLSPTQRAALLTAQRPTAIDLDVLRASEGAGLLHQLVSQRARLQQFSELAGQLGDVRGAISAEAAVTGNLALVGKLLGQLSVTHHVRHTSILISPDYLKLRAALVQALRQYPDAAKAVAAALFALESDAAKDITDAAKPAPVMIEHVPPAPLPPPPPC
jgi:hypothetical protein